MLLLHKKNHSPDPLYGRNYFVQKDGWSDHSLWPVEVIYSEGVSVRQAGNLGRWRDPGPLKLVGNTMGYACLLLDFGTELEASLRIEIEARGPSNIYATFGECRAEAEGYGEYGQGRWQQVRHWHIDSSGRHQHSFETTGFRFVRLQFHDLVGSEILHCVSAEARFMGTPMQGDFLCSDTRLNRLWHTCAYTARLCTRPDGFWDGIKRDRMGWYGDARITARAWDATFFDSGPGTQMLDRLPTERWVNGIPNFSFDAISMLVDQIRTYGLDLPRRAEKWVQVQSLLEWVQDSQVNADGLLYRGIKTRRNHDEGKAENPVELFFDYGFVDWSAMPVGGRLEELGWLQCRYLQALYEAEQLARWIGDAPATKRFAERGAILRDRILALFYEEGIGLHHSLNIIRTGFEKYAPGWAAPSYATTNSPRLKSGPSRHATALATFAGLHDGGRGATLLSRGFDTTGQPPVITPMFCYYEAEARALLGDPADGFSLLAGYLTDMVETNDAATIWESFEPEIKDFRKWGLGGWPKSLCHGWGAGFIPFVQRWVLGLECLAPGWSEVRIHCGLPLTGVRAKVPTPHGIIEICEGETRLPKGIQQVP